MVTHQLQVERRTETDVLPLCHAANYLRNYTCDIHQLFVQVTYGRGAVLLWRRCDTLCTSGFVDDVMFAHQPTLLDVAAQLKRNTHTHTHTTFPGGNNNGGGVCGL